MCLLLEISFPEALVMIATTTIFAKVLLDFNFLTNLSIVSICSLISYFIVFMYFVSINFSCDNCLFFFDWEGEGDLLSNVKLAVPKCRKK